MTGSLQTRLDRVVIDASGRDAEDEQNIERWITNSRSSPPVMETFLAFL